MIPNNGAGELAGPLIWIPRPHEDADQMASALTGIGARPLVAPLLSIVFSDEEPDLAEIKGLLFTSANGVRAFANASGDRTLPVYAVGPRSAEVARETGFTSVSVAGGNVDLLADHVAASRSPSDGMLLHIAGTERAGDLVQALEKHGFAVRRQVFYSAEAATELPEDVLHALQTRTLDACAIFSPRTASLIVSLVKKAGLEDSLKHVTALCLSDNVSTNASALNWCTRVVSSKPDGEAMLQLIREVFPTLSTLDPKGPVVRDQDV